MQCLYVLIASLQVFAGPSGDTNQDQFVDSDSEDSDDGCNWAFGGGRQRRANHRESFSMDMEGEDFAVPPVAPQAPPPPPPNWNFQNQVIRYERSYEAGPNLAPIRLRNTTQSHCWFTGALMLIIYAKRKTPNYQMEIDSVDVDHLVNFNDGFDQILHHWPQLTGKYIVDSRPVVSMFCIDYIGPRNRDQYMNR